MYRFIFFKIIQIVRHVSTGRFLVENKNPFWRSFQYTSWFWRTFWKGTKSAFWFDLKNVRLALLCHRTSLDGSCNSFTHSHLFHEFFKKFTFTFGHIYNWFFWGKYVWWKIVHYFLGRSSLLQFLENFSGLFSSQPLWNLFTFSRESLFSLCGKPLHVRSHLKQAWTRQNKSELVRTRPNLLRSVAVRSSTRGPARATSAGCFAGSRGARRGRAGRWRTRRGGGAWRPGWGRPPAPRGPGSGSYGRGLQCSPYRVRR